ncbi:MAG TPA: intradiol ring-cleavage dioxygenase [Gaiellaceae bacterium]|nr:intradiol ring-cleavage dioxygenase [Gaiellaceae bacterium]
MDEDRDHLTTRRDSLVKAGGLLVAALGAKSVLTGGAAAATEGTGPAAVASGALTCVLTPEMTEGPFYVPGEKVRRNITEGRPGTPLTLKLKVVNASTCRAIKGAAVDVWHADAGGTYSGVQGSAGTTFMRGIQPTDAKGVVEFVTVYPGWYQGRTVHIHVKVHLGGNVVHTGQLFFQDTLTDAVYKAVPYNTRGARDTRNADDSIYVNGGKLSMLALTRSGSGYVGAIAMGVHRS